MGYRRESKVDVGGSNGVYEGVREYGVYEGVWGLGGSNGV